MASRNHTVVIRKVKKAGHAPHHGGAWKVAYADFVTAMMAFFMLLWLMSNPDKKQLRGLAEYFSPASESTETPKTLTNQPGAQPGLGGHSRRAQSADVTPVGQPASEAGAKGVARGGEARVPEAALRVMAQEMQLALEKPDDPRDPSRNYQVESTPDGLRIHLFDTPARSMFKGGTAQLNGYAREVLARIGQKLAGTGGQLAIEGHTDGVGGDSASNWELSAQRALSARSALVASGLALDRFSEVVAKGASDPVYPDEPDRPENRRITIIVKAEPSAFPRDPSFAF